MTHEPWSKATRDAWFLGLLGLTTAACAYLFSPYLYVLATAGVVVIVSWPLYLRILERVQGRSALAAALATCLLCFLVLGPLGAIGYLFLVEGILLGQSGVEWLQGAEFQLLLTDLQNVSEDPRVELVKSWLPVSVDKYLAELNLVETISGPVQQATVKLVNTLSEMLPQVVTAAVGAGIDATIFLFATVTFYMEGPKIVGAVKKLSPIDDAYEDRLFAVFAEFANNMVVASLATAAVQGVVAALGYGIAGVDRVIFLGILTAAFSFIPLVGTAAVWVPVAIGVGLSSGWGWAAFVAAWSLGFTGTVDNVLKPLFLRGNTNIHPLLIFLSVFGGMSWLGLAGALVGPLIVALFLSMYTMYKEDFLGEEPHGVLSDEGSWLDTVRRWMPSGGAAEEQPPLIPANELPTLVPPDDDDATDPGHSEGARSAAGTTATES